MCLFWFLEERREFQLIQLRLDRIRRLREKAHTVHDAYERLNRFKYEIDANLLHRHPIVLSCMYHAYTKARQRI